MRVANGVLNGTRGGVLHVDVERAEADVPVFVEASTSDERVSSVFSLSVVQANSRAEVAEGASIEPLLIEVQARLQLLAHACGQTIDQRDDLVARQPGAGGQFSRRTKS